MTGRKVMGIVGCEVLEDEIAYVVSTDHDVKSVIIVDGRPGGTIAKKVHHISPHLSVHTINEGQDITSVPLPLEMSIIVWIKPICLHQSPPLLRDEVVQAIKTLETSASSILLFYGQCGNAFRNMEKVVEAFHVPITILKGSDDSLVDDCTGTVLGGREEYRNFLIKTQGAYVVNTMWAANWRNYMKETQMLHDPNDLDEVKEVFKYMDYRRAVGLNTGLGDQAEFDRQLDEFARIFGMQKEHLPCTLRVVERSYLEAKRHMT